mmetsp:Transcript_15354/g.43254  ORF Transcript_15354/g.43254 Transcript_15354/m.43254 type:complete len:219 (+) Transcript_15354:252-908(+)
MMPSFFFLLFFCDPHQQTFWMAGLLSIRSAFFVASSSRSRSIWHLKSAMVSNSSSALMIFTLREVSASFSLALMETRLGSFEYFAAWYFSLDFWRLAAACFLDGRVLLSDSVSASIFMAAAAAGLTVWSISASAFLFATISRRRNKSLRSTLDGLVLVLRFFLIPRSLGSANPLGTDRGEEEDDPMDPCGLGWYSGVMAARYMSEMLLSIEPIGDPRP